MNAIHSRLPALCLPLAMAAVFLISCSAHIRDASGTGPAIGGLFLAEDGAEARITFSAEPGGAFVAGGRDSVTLIHERSGITITCPLVAGKDGYSFSNYGRLLRRGDRVAVLIEGLTPAWAVLE